MASSTIKSKVPIMNRHLLSEISEDTIYHAKLIEKYKLSTLKVKIADLNKIEEYNLSDVAKQMGINDAVANEPLALNIIKSCLGPTYEYRKDSEPIIGGKGVSRLKKCYISTHPNRGDVMVSKDGSDVLYTEVHSDGTYDCTARKTVYLLMECLRMLKAFGVKKPEMDAFVFPRKEYKRCVVRIRMQYLPMSVKFQYYVTCLQIDEVSSALTNAIQSNEAVCQNLTYQSPELEYILWLTDEERGQWGFELKNAKSGFGILLMNDDICLKKPKCSASFEKLNHFSESQDHGRVIQCMPIYTIVDIPQFVKYNKICHDPLSYEEGRRCCYELVKKIYEITQCIHIAGHMHNDLRLPNICFNRNFQPILIDFDLSTRYSQSNNDADMEKFATEMVKCFGSSKEAISDLFIQEYSKGRYDESLLKTSIVATRKSPVREIINDRNAS